MFTRSQNKTRGSEKSTSNTWVLKRISLEVLNISFPSFNNLLKLLLTPDRPTGSSWTLRFSFPQRRTSPCEYLCICEICICTSPCENSRICVLCIVYLCICTSPCEYLWKTSRYLTFCFTFWFSLMILLLQICYLWRSYYSSGTNALQVNACFLSKTIKFYFMVASRELLHTYF